MYYTLIFGEMKNIDLKVLAWGSIGTPIIRFITNRWIM